MSKEEKTLASELLQELKATNKRLFVSLIVVIILWFATIVGFVIYESQYETQEVTTDTTEIDTDTGDNSSNDIKIGDINNG